MLTLAQSTEVKPVHIIYLGTEDEFFEEVREIIDSIKHPDELDLTYCDTPAKALQTLYEHQNPDHPPVKVIVYGMFSHLEQTGQDSNENITRVWGAIYESGVQNVGFGDRKQCQFVDDLLAIEEISEDESDFSDASIESVEEL